MKNIYKQAGKCDYQQQLKDIIKSAMVSTPVGFTDNSFISPMTSLPAKTKVHRNHCVCLLTFLM